MTQSHAIAVVYPSGKAMCACGRTFDDITAIRAHFAHINSNPAVIHGAEQLWADASKCLDNFLAYLREQLPDLHEIVGGNTDPSIVFDFMKSYIVESELSSPGTGHKATILFCAAAITRLVSAPLTDDVLAQLDKEMEQDK